ncbi:hypothetical protein BDR03DRAFT_956217 [Suillus americanus]|nr:hypothetical protein BDR03DRAFT_956217 [Suillus americanus]
MGMARVHSILPLSFLLSVRGGCRGSFINPPSPCFSGPEEYFVEPVSIHISLQRELLGSVANESVTRGSSQFVHLELSHYTCSIYWQCALFYSN